MTNFVENADYSFNATRKRNSPVSHPCGRIIGRGLSTLIEMCQLMSVINAIVNNRKIEIDAPSELPDGSPVSVVVVGLPTNSEPMSAEEIASTVHAMDLFVATFAEQVDAEDFSAAARIAGDAEKKEFFEYANKLARMFD